MSTPKRIRDLRTGLGLSQKEFGEQIGIGDSYVSELEAGKKSPSDSVLLNIEYRFGVRSEWLKTGKGSKYIKDKIKLTKEEIEIIKALRDKLGFKESIQFLAEDVNKLEKSIQKIAKDSKIPFEYVNALLLISEKLKKY